jgi:SAM-dependent methyltransferase
VSVHTEGLAYRPRLEPTSCAICGVENESDEIYPASLKPEALTPATFSARRLPDRTHHRLVRCRCCGLVRSDPVVDQETMVSLYRASAFAYGQELDGLKMTYGRALQRISDLVPSRDGLLDVGCGNGFVLELALELGWNGVRGVEPSEDAIAHASAGVAPLIERGLLERGMFAPASFDAVTLFQVLDHLRDPVEVLSEIHHLLRPGGVVLALNHNVEAFSARVLRERSPIIDVEHTYLYSPGTMRRLFSQAGFEVMSVEPIRNTYSLSYLVHLTPFPHRLKASFLARLKRSRLGQAMLTVPLGNLCLLGRRGT